MQDIYLLHYNNYYNRIVKNAGNLLADYTEFIVGEKLDTNFNPNDGIYTTTEIGTGDFNTAADYLLVFEKGAISDPTKWFILEANRTRLGQYELILVRDVIGENYNSVLNAPAFVEKGWVPNTDPAVFNSEGISFNQIKKNETRLYDYTGIPWIVGYMASYKSEADQENDYSLSLSGTFNVSSDYGFDTITDVPFYQHIKNIAEIDPSITAKPLYVDSANDFTFSFRTQNVDSSGYLYVQPKWNISPNVSYNTGENMSSGEAINTGYALRGDVFSLTGSTVDINKVLTEDGVKLSRLAVLAQQANYKAGLGIYTPTDLLAASELNEKTIYLRDIEKYFKFQLSYKQRSYTEFSIPTSNNASSIFSNLGAKTTYFSGDNDGSLVSEILVDNYELEIIEIEAAGYKIEIPTSRNHLSNAPYDMFAIPFGNFNFNGTTTNSEIALAAANIILRQGGSFVYDVQLLPYCPFQNLQKSGDTYTLGDLTEDTDYVVITDADGTNPKSIMFWATQSNFTFNIEQPIVVDDYKITNECDMWRLCSPNYNGVFEFNAAKNNGVDYFNVDCTYKPFTPYIHLNPNFKGLYGADYNDARGLICGGDFSLSAITDAFREYELQNKNYEKTFQRQIENLEVQHEVAKIQDATNAVFGTIAGGMQGSMLGAAGGPVGAIAGGVAGTIASGIGGAVDVSLNERLRNETLDYTKDLYNYNLGNIKALPNSLAKVSAFTFNNKIIPFLEYYTCTDIEKQALRDKIKYNGMTIMRIGKLIDFIQPGVETYVKGKLIRWNDFCEDYHFVNYLAEELNKGVFINEYSE